MHFRNPEILDLSRQAYQSRYEDAFDLLVPKLPQDQIQTLAQQAYADMRLDYFEIALLSLPAQQRSEWAEKPMRTAGWNIL